MTLAEIEDHWIIDQEIDLTSIINEMVRITKLHGKYLRELNQAGAKLEHEKNKLDVIYRDKYEAYVLPSRKLTFAEQQASPIGKWEKGAFKDIFLPADPEYQQQRTAVSLAQHKVDVLKLILRELNGYNQKFQNINTARRFEAGG